MLNRWTKGLLHLLVGGACAALVAWLVFGFSQTVLHTSGPVRVTMAALVVITLLLVGWLLLAPPVRPAEIALARALLDVDLPEPVDTSSWGARGRGLLWAGAVIVLGGLSLLALLWCLPQGLAMVVQAFSDDLSTLLPPELTGIPAPVLAVVGLGVAALGLLVQPLLVTVLRRLAPQVLGPTPADRLAHEQQVRDQLLRANELARELHDSVGHALTAIGVQAEAGARVARQDPAFAREALDRISATTRQAVAELDEVLGTLRTSTERVGTPTSTPTERVGTPTPTLTERAGTPTPTPTERASSRESAPPSASALGDLLAPFGPDGTGSVRLDIAGEVDEEAGHTAYRVVQEALTNARRHGTGAPAGHVRVRDGWVDVALENPVDPDAAPDPEGRGGRGLTGMRERLTLVGGSLNAGPETVDGRSVWRLVARFPAQREARP